ncbi:poly [ADP-ribose] polymerase [Plutella xylostella]|uniref:poly [ADP-ribose] polymerase n=1 Tax=Plutella xylostella TaxID=51655 RepID=UPI0020327672|nr:poly [ADP-ribose] polymerase [Plutella xylostella]
MDDLPYQAEYAKSGRANCKGCKEKIEQGTLRIAVMVQSAFYDGKQANWHHEECFFKKQRPKTALDIGRLNTLRNDDQKRITKAIEEYTGIVLPVAKGKSKAAKRANAEASASMAAIKDFFIEYSKSSRATCRVCEIKICKDEVRISKTVYDTEVGQKYGGQALWHHVKCFAEARAELLYMAGGEDLPGFKVLKKEDQAMVKQELKPFKVEEVPVKRLKEEPKDEKDIKEEKDLEKKLKKQNTLYYKYHDGLSDCSKKDLQAILEANSQEVPPGIDEPIIRIADMMAFGALEPCDVCKQGQLVLGTNGYTCSGNVSEWTKCTHVTQEPKRKPMKVPKEFKKMPIFQKFKPKVGVRLFQAAPPPPPLLIIKKEEPAENGVKKERRIPPLKNLQFFIWGRGLKGKEELKHRILKLGGLVVSKLTDTVAAVVSTKKDLENMASKMLEIQEKDIEVVEESFIDLIDPETGTIARSIELIKENNIADWGSDPAKRIPQDVMDGKSIPKSGSMYVKSEKSGTKKLKLKGGTAVDPDSGLEDVAHVYKDHDGTKYTVVLGQTDVVAKKNSYYKMQILEADDKKKYWLFRAWGRIGTTIGSSKVETCKNVDEALRKFEDLYMEKTENPWEMRDHFEKVPGCYCPVDVDYGDDEASAKVLKADDKCKLPMPVQNLVLTIFDINVMKKTLLEFELDTEKMPLGKLSKKQIKAGYKVLCDLLKHIEKGMASKNKLIDATNSFYTLIPHNFGVQNAPMLDNVELIKKKTEMLDNLLEIEIAYSLLKSDSDDSDMSPIEAHYLKLKTRIEPVVRGGAEFLLLEQYVRNTHAATHSQYTLEIQEVFKVVREGEDKRYKPFRKLHNRRLLWHGSRVTNFAGILSQGLRIAPPEAPVTGYMFGKGIYFADMVSKSANYCCSNKAAPVGVMLLCEVALGDMQECSKAEYFTKPPAGKHSVWGMGRTQPDPAQNVVLESGTIVPCGTPQQRDVSTSLLYNEFIVYDVAQVNVQYLFQMKFNFKY